MNAQRHGFLALLTLAASILVVGCGERPPVDTVQRGYRGLAMGHISNPRLVADQQSTHQMPEPIAAVPAGSPPAGTVYKNVQVLNNLGVAEFTRLMVAITNWVSPQQGCAYCHAPGEDFAADTLYTKVVARRMLQMTRDINVDWKTHVAATGVTCYTCHRGQPVPADIWFKNPGPRAAQNVAGNRAGQNYPASQIGLTSLPYDPFTPFLLENNEIRIQSNSALPDGNRHSIKQTEWTYALMMHMSQSLGVNCTYCHNSRSFMPWDASTPERAPAWHGIRMVRELNTRHLEPLRASLPAERLGPMGDAPKLNCATCHQGAYKPLYGASMLKDYPELGAAATSAQPAAQQGRPDPARAPAVPVGEPLRSTAASTR